MKIVIAESGPAENIGSMALIENAIKIARMKFPEADITVLTPTVSSVKGILEKDRIMGIKVMKDLFVKPSPRSSKIFKTKWLIQNIFWILFVRFFQFFKINPVFISSGNRRKVLKEVKDSSYVFCIGAERINDVFFKTVFFSLEALRIYQRQGKKLVHFSLTIGPLFYRLSMRKAHVVLNNSHAIFIRDQKSFEWLQKLNVTKPLIYNSYDIAILQEKNKNADDLLNEFGIKEGYIGVSFIEWAFRKVEGPVRMEGYINAVAETLDYIIEKYKYQIVLVPTVVNCGGYKLDDVEACKKVLIKMKNIKNVVLIDKLLSPKELATVFAACKYSIVTRMHAAILCSGSGQKPIIAINYLYKLREFMKNIGFEDYSVDIDYVDSKELIPRIQNMESLYDTNLGLLNNNMNKCVNKLINDLNAYFDN